MQLPSRWDLGRGEGPMEVGFTGNRADGCLSVFGVRNKRRDHYSHSPPPPSDRRRSFELNTCGRQPLDPDAQPTL